MSLSANFATVNHLLINALVLEAFQKIFPGIEREYLTEMIIGVAERGVSAERVAARAAGELKKYIAADVAVWKHLADQLLLPMAIAKGGRFSKGPLTPHFESNAEVIEMFTGLKIQRDTS